MFGTTSVEGVDFIADDKVRFSLGTVFDSSTTGAHNRSLDFPAATAIFYARPRTSSQRYIKTSAIPPEWNYNGGGGGGERARNNNRDIPETPGPVDSDGSRR